MWNPFRRRVAAKAFDVSNYWLPGPVTDGNALTMMYGAKERGNAGVMLGTYDTEIASQQSWAAMVAGLWRDAFDYLYFDGFDNGRIDRGATVKITGLTWIDCENEDSDVASLAVPEVIAHIQAAIDYAWTLGLKPAIYTRPLWWKTYTRNTTQFAAYPLWVADPDGIAKNDAAYWKRIAFGGFARPVWKQYAFNQNIDGMNVDLSVGQS